MQRLHWAATILCGLALAGCAPHTMRVPPDFVPFDKEDFGTHHLRAISADGVVVGLKSEMNLKEATLDFWAQALTNELVESKGYRHEKTDDVTSETGTPGKFLTFTTETRGVAFTYVVALFVQPEVILIAEAGGKTDALKPKLDAVRKALLSAK